jgi:acyl-CoA thioesterase-2
MSPSTTFDQLLPCLTSPQHVPLDDGLSVWRASTLDISSAGVFGGELLGQTVAIAGRLDPAKMVKSVSAVFPRGVRDTGSLDYHATTMASGSAYATHRIDVVQPDRNGHPSTAFSAFAMCHQLAPGIEHARPLPDGAGRPEDAHPLAMGLIPWDTRVVGSTDMNDRRAQPAELMVWMRVPTALPDDLVLHQSLLAYFSDLTLIGTAILPHEGWSQLDCHVALRTSVIAHRIVFHRPFRIDEWLLLAQSSPVASGGSAYGSGHVFTQAGELVASVEQESMVRVAEAR